MTLAKRLAVGVTASAALVSLSSVANASTASAKETTTDNAAGYAAQANSITSVSASWTVPTLQSNSANGSAAVPTVVLANDTGSVFTQAGIIEVDSSGSTIIKAYYSFDTQSSTVSLSNPVKAGDKITASAEEISPSTSDDYTISITDHTQNWTVKRTAAENANNVSDVGWALVTDDSSGLADFNKIEFTDVTVDGKAIGAQKPDEFKLVSGNAQADTSGISSGQNFTVTWNRVRGE